MIELAAVTKAYHQGTPSETWAVRGVDLEIPSGRATLLMGPSGSGKTTLLTLVGGLARPTSGRVRLHGREVSGLSDRFLTVLRRRTFGFVFQQFNLVRGLSALENVMIPAYPLAPPHAELRAKAGGLLERLGLSHRASAKVELLSGGEAQRVAIARALVNDPEVIIADEPTANLDTHLSREILAVFAGLKRDGRTILLTSHDPLVRADPLVDAVINMRDGVVVDAAPPGATP